MSKIAEFLKNDNKKCGYCDEEMADGVRVELINEVFHRFVCSQGHITDVRVFVEREK